MEFDLKVLCGVTCQRLNLKSCLSPLVKKNLCQWLVRFVVPIPAWISEALGKRVPVNLQFCDLARERKNRPTLEWTRQCDELKRNSGWTEPRVWENTSASTDEGIWHFNGLGDWAVSLVTDRY